MTTKKPTGLFDRLVTSLLSPADPSNLAVLRIAFGESAFCLGHFMVNCHVKCLLTCQVHVE